MKREVIAATLVGNGGLWHAGIVEDEGVTARTLCGRTGEVDHDHQGRPVAAVLELSAPTRYEYVEGPPLEQPIECLVCRDRFEVRARFWGARVLGAEEAS